jgi:hypothetical protein
MKKGNYLFLLINILVVISMTGCSVVSAFSPTETPTNTPQPTLTPTPTVTPTPTEIPFYLNATVYSGNLQVPIILYHRFVPDYATTDATKMRLSDFSEQIQTLYDNGFYLVSLKDWLEGTFVVPVGKKPLIITLDDLWFADQLYINPDGTPSLNSGLGLLWHFSQEHPDFGYSAAVFSNMGDKYYGDKQVGDMFQLGEGDAWKTKLGETIAWAVDHGIEPYNHLYVHPMLSKMTSNADIKWQIEMNDHITRLYLSLVGREDLFPKLGNIIALPFGEWPATESGINVLKNYNTPEGKPLEAIMEAYNLGNQELTPSIFSDGFDPFNIARLTASTYMIQWVIEQKESIPTAMNCQLGPLTESQSGNLEVVQAAIQSAISSQACPEGVYNVNGSVFVAKAGVVTLFKANTDSEVAEQPTPTQTTTP